MPVDLADKIAKNAKGKNYELELVFESIGVQEQKSSASQASNQAGANSDWFTEFALVWLAAWPLLDVFRCKGLFKDFYQKRRDEMSLKLEEIIIQSYQDYRN